MARPRDSVPELSTAIAAVLLTILIPLGAACAHGLIHYTRESGPHACYLAALGGLLLLGVGAYVLRYLESLDHPAQHAPRYLAHAHVKPHASSVRLTPFDQAHIREDRAWAKVVVVVGALVALYAALALVLSRVHTS